MLALLLSGCFTKKRPSADEIHGVTKELVAAAQSVIGTQARITIRPISATLMGGKTYLAEDQIAIVLEDPANKRRWRARWMASRSVTTSLAVRLLLRAMSWLLRTSRARNARTRFISSNGPQQLRRKPQLCRRRPQLAIIVDDLGHDLPPLHEILQIGYPLTISVIPNLPESAETAEEAHRRGDEVLLHLPMQAIEPDAKTETVELRVGMKSNQVDQTLSAMLATVPHAAGVNNHQGSRATADPALMNSLMSALKRRGLFFVDSRTTKETVAYDMAEKDHVRAAFRNAQFLDDTPTEARHPLAAKPCGSPGEAHRLGHHHRTPARGHNRSAAPKSCRRCKAKACSWYSFLR